MDNFVCVGKILKPQALKGEVKIAVSMQNLEDFLSYEYIYLGQDYAKFAVEKCRVHDGFIVAKLSGVNDANAAETLRNEQVFVEKTQLSPLDDGEYYIQDLVGLSVFSNDSSACFGQIVAVDNFSSSDIITMKGESGEILFPFLESVVLDIDLKNGKMVVDTQKFKEVCVDEN